MFLITDKIGIMIKKVDLEKEMGIAMLYLKDYSLELRSYTIKKSRAGEWFVSPPSVWIPEKKMWFWQARFHNRAEWDLLQKAIIKLFLAKFESERAAAAARAASQL